MKIGIISDTHDRIVNVDKFINWCKKNSPEVIIHCGDVATSSTLQHLLNNVSSSLYLSLGNAEINPEEIKTLQNFIEKLFVFENFGELEVKNIKIAFVHYPWVAKKLAQKNTHHFIFYGHTHKPWTEKIDGVYLINPGNLKGEPYQPTFCVLDLEKKKFELVLVNQI